MRLPDRRAQMREVPMRLGARRHQHELRAGMCRIAGSTTPSSGGLASSSAKLMASSLRRDLPEQRRRVVIHHRLDGVELVVGVALGDVGDPLPVEGVGRLARRPNSCMRTTFSVISEANGAVRM